jgi:hypothetical protein
MRRLDRRLRAGEKRLSGDDTLTAILPDWLYDGNQPAARPGEKIITPSNYLAYDSEKDEVYYEQ